MKAHDADAELRRALQLLGQSIARTGPLLRFGRGGVENVSRVRDHVPRRNRGLCQRRAKSLNTLRTDRHLVAVVLGDRGEDLQRLHTGASRAARGHVDAAIVDRVSAQKECHWIRLYEVNHGGRGGRGGKLRCPPCPPRPPWFKLLGLFL